MNTAKFAEVEAQERATKEQERVAMLSEVVTTLACGVTAETWNHLGTYVRTTLPVEFHPLFLHTVHERAKHDDCAGIREMHITVIRSKLYKQWLNDRPMQDLLRGNNPVIGLRS